MTQGGALEKIDPFQSESDSAPAQSGRDSNRAEGGLRVHLDGIALADVIQICCNTKRRLVIELQAEQRIGRLYFDEGQLLHAEYAGQQGLDAVVVMLQLSEGVVSTVSHRWKRELTIGMRADALLLTVAHQMDERHRSGEGAAAGEMTTKVVRKVDATSDTQRPSASFDHAEELALGGDLSDLRIAQISKNGSIHRCRGGATQEFADTTFFSQVAADRLGKLVKLGACRALGYVGESQGFAVFRGQSIVGIAGRTEPISLVMRKLGLV